jgi:hypothetical protein
VSAALFGCRRAPSEPALLFGYDTGWPAASVVVPPSVELRASLDGAAISQGIYSAALLLRNRGANQVSFTYTDCALGLRAYRSTDLSGPPDWENAVTGLPCAGSEITALIAPGTEFAAVVRGGSETALVQTLGECYCYFAVALRESGRILLIPAGAAAVPAARLGAG